jgi:NAD(P)-dependent dehydrogenase (short-subunit alcohol dehydrogenase family)
MILNDAMREMLEARGSVSRDLRNALPVEAIEPEDVSNAIAWLVGDEAKYVTGVTVPVDAGYTNKK